MIGAGDRPLVLIAELDDESFAWLDGLRRRHFPPERNHLAAHLTLFHALPSHHDDRVVEVLAAMTCGRPPIGAVAAHWMRLDARFSPGRVCLTALPLWRYDGGPWEFLRQLPLPGEHGSRTPVVSEPDPRRARLASPPARPPQ